MGKFDFRPKSGCRICVRVLVFFGAPLDFRGGPLDLPWGASGAIFPPTVPQARNQPGGIHLPKKFRRLRRTLVVLIVFGACGGLGSYFILLFRLD